MTFAKPPKSVFMVALLLVSTLALPFADIPEVEARTFTAYPNNGQWIEMPDDNRFGPYETVEIEFGEMAVLGSCEEDNGTVDAWYPWTDVYVVPGGPFSETELEDVNGRPNSVMGLSGGSIAFEPIMQVVDTSDTISRALDKIPKWVSQNLSKMVHDTTQLKSGPYSIIFDECQDGVFNPGEDALFQDAFYLDIPSEIPALPDAILEMKIAAAKQAAWSYGLQKAMAGNFALWEKYRDLRAATNPSMALLNFLQDQAFKGLGSPQEVFDSHLGNLVNQNLGIAADPPQYNYQHHHIASIPSWVGGWALETPTDVYFQDAARWLEIEEAFAHRLLDSMELYQGAAAARDGEWAYRHARAATESAGLLVNLTDEVDARLLALRNHVAALNPGVDYTDMQQALGHIKLYGFNATQVVEARNAGFTEAQLDAARQYLIDGGEPNATWIEIVAAFDDLAATRDEYRTALANFETGLDNNTNFIRWQRHTFAEPFAATPILDGDHMLVNGTWSNLVHAGWDLNMDGSFADHTSWTGKPGIQVGAHPVIGLEVFDERTHQLTYHRTPFTLETGTDWTTMSPLGTHVVNVGDTLQLEASWDNPHGADLVEWWVNGQRVTSAYHGESFLVDTSAPGLYNIQANTQAQFQLLRAAHWTVIVNGPDADGDGWQSHVDCNDADAAINPGAQDIQNGIDDDCDPATPDGGMAPVVDAGADEGSAEGIQVRLFTSTSAGSHSSGIREATFTHPDQGANGTTFTATIDWGDGTVEAAPINETTWRIDGSHAYRDDGDHLVEICVTVNTGNVGCDTFWANITNRAPAVDFMDLSTWRPGGGWVISPDGQSATSYDHDGNQGFMSTNSMSYGWYNLTVQVHDDVDYDYIGFVFGQANKDDGTTNRPFSGGSDEIPEDWQYLIDWKGDTDAGWPCAPEGLAFSRAHIGVGEYWCHPQPHVQELARGATRGATGWTAFAVHNFTVHHEEDRFRVWVDDDLEIDWTGGQVPKGRMGFFANSQIKVTYSALDTPNQAVFEGASTIQIPYGDLGVDDTHTARVNFGDGSPDEAINLHFNGWGGKYIIAPHKFADDGTYEATACVTDDEEATGCNTGNVDVFNLPPVVDAGANRTTGLAVPVLGVPFTDPGTGDTHTATVNWGDGANVAAGVDQGAGFGTVTGNHTYAAPGDYIVTVCVTDDDGGSHCDNFTAHAQAPAAPEVFPFPAIGHTGAPARLAYGYMDDAGDSHTARIDWGSGFVAESIDRPEHRGGFDHAWHHFTTTGTYPVTVEVCDQGGLCHTNSTTVTITEPPFIFDPTDDSIVMDEDTIAVRDVLANDAAGRSGAPFAVSQAWPAAHGSLAWNGGVVTYTPNHNFYGTDHFQYDVSHDGQTERVDVYVTVNGVDEPPVAVDQDIFVTEDVLHPWNLDLSDPDHTGWQINLQVVQAPAYGFVSLGGNAQGTYYPPADHCNDGSAPARPSVPDSFTYRATDPDGLTDTATVTIHIACVQSAPTLPHQNLTTLQDAPVSWSLDFADDDHGDWQLAIDLLTAPAHGAVTLAGDTATYTPSPAYCNDGRNPAFPTGADEAQVRVTDPDGLTAVSNITVAVTCINGPPIAGDQVIHAIEDTAITWTLDVADVDHAASQLSYSATDGPGHGAVQFDGNGAATFSPAPDYCNDAAAPDTFRVLFTDPDGRTDNATIMVHVACVNDAPVAGDDHAATDAYHAVTGNVLANDWDVEDERNLTLRIVAAPANGTATLGPNGDYSYTPDPIAFRGGDAFTYEACDQSGEANGCTMATVFVSEIDCTDGLHVLAPTPLAGTLSGTVHSDVEPVIARYEAGLAGTVNGLVCDYVVPVEDAVNDAT